MVIPIHIRLKYEIDLFQLLKRSDWVELFNDSGFPQLSPIYLDQLSLSTFTAPGIPLNIVYGTKWIICSQLSLFPRIIFILLFFSGHNVTSLDSLSYNTTDFNGAYSMHMTDGDG
ncbi:MAG: hypothetical protein H0U27_01795 [Nitrosopumilus sp.]|nr:hypothetical protein [Nitrosopumilus sp.]